MSLLVAWLESHFRSLTDANCELLKQAGEGRLRLGLVSGDNLGAQTRATRYYVWPHRCLAWLRSDCARILGRPVCLCARHVHFATRFQVKSDCRVDCKVASFETSVFYRLLGNRQHKDKFANLQACFVLLQATKAPKITFRR